MSKQTEGKAAGNVARLERPAREAEARERAPAPKSRPVFHVEGLIAHVRKITTTDDGKLQIVLEGEGLDDPTIAKVQDLLQLQPDLVLVSIRQAQGDLFN